MGFPFLFALCASASIVIWFVDIEKGRDNCRVYVEERKLVRVAKEAGLTTEEVVEGVMRRYLGTIDSQGSLEAADIEDPDGGRKDIIQ